LFSKKEEIGKWGFFNPSPGDSRTKRGRPVVLPPCRRGSPPHPTPRSRPQTSKERERDRARKEGESGLRPLPRATPTHAPEREREVPATDARPSPPVDAQFGPERDRGSAGEEREGQGGRSLWVSAAPPRFAGRRQLGSR